MLLGGDRDHRMDRTWPMSECIDAKQGPMLVELNRYELEFRYTQWDSVPLTSKLLACILASQRVSTIVL